MSEPGFMGFAGLTGYGSLDRESFAPGLIDPVT